MSHAPFLANAGAQFFGEDSFPDLSKLKEFQPIFEGPRYAKWRSFRESEDSRYVGLTMPRFLLRLPYGEETVPVKSFNFQEEAVGDHDAYLWGSSSFSFAARVTDSFAKYRWCPNIIGPQAGGAVENLPLHQYEAMGETQTKIPTEVQLTERQEASSRRPLARRVRPARGRRLRRASSYAGWAARRSAATSPRRRSASASRRRWSTVRGYRLPAWAGADWTVLCSSYSGGTEETLACFEAATALGARRIVAGTGGPLVDRAREEGVPVVGLPGILQPRAAVAYMVVVAAEVAALAGVAPRIETEIEDAAALLERRDRATSRPARRRSPSAWRARCPSIYGGELTMPVARRWKTQINENAKLQAFFSELPEADHNEICGWAGLPEGTRLSVVMLEDADQHPRLRRRFELTAEAIAATGTEVGAGRDRGGDAHGAALLRRVMLGDLVSLRLAAARGVDPLPVEAIDALKSALAQS